MRFGRLVFIEKSEKKCLDGSFMWVCRCDCGNLTTVNPCSVKSGNTKSCGCLQRERAKTLCESRAVHNHARRGAWSDTYKAWRYMRNRVARDKDYSHVTIDPSWDNFEVFLKDMGEKPKGLTLDRIDNFKPYSKDNCRWADRICQARNKTNSLIISYADQSFSLKEWSEKLGISYSTLHQRLYKLGWSVSRAFNKIRSNSDEL